MEREVITWLQTAHLFRSINKVTKTQQGHRQTNCWPIDGRYKWLWEVNKARHKGSVEEQGALTQTQDIRGAGDQGTRGAGAKHRGPGGKVINTGDQGGR